MVNVGKEIHINHYYETCYKRNVIRLKIVYTSIYITLVISLISIFSHLAPYFDHHTVNFRPFKIYKNVKWFFTSQMGVKVTDFNLTYKIYIYTYIH
jgi:hypothetical protein